MILSPDGDAASDAAAYVVQRARAVRKLGYIPAETPAEEAAAVQEFVVALSKFPQWAIERAFDEWVRTSPRKPSPAEIVILARRAVQPITDELNRREKADRDRRDQMREVTPQQREAADAVLLSCGFTPRRFDLARRRPMLSANDLRDHSLDDVEPETFRARAKPCEDELERIRAANPLIAAARAASGWQTSVQDDDEGRHWDEPDTSEEDRAHG